MIIKQKSNFDSIYKLQLCAYMAMKNGLQTKDIEIDLDSFKITTFSKLALFLPYVSQAKYELFNNNNHIY